MKISSGILAAALTVVSSAALAQDAMTGTVTRIDRISGTIAIQQTQSGTVGANTTGSAREFKLQGGMLDTLHAGDKVMFSAKEAGGAEAITKIEKQ